MLTKIRPLSMLLLLSSFLLACQAVTGLLATATPPPVTPPPPAVTQSAPATVAATVVQPAATATAGVPTPAAPEATDPGPHVWPAAQPLPDPFSSEPITASEVRTAQALLDAHPPERDDVSLARLYLGLAELPPPAAPAEPLQAGATSPFNVLNLDSNVNVAIEASLLAVSDHAYFWFDVADYQPTGQELAPVTAAFDQIYEAVTGAFGVEERPGIDGNSRLHVLNASPGAICDDASFCSIAGYFSSADALPRAVYASSNERDMFVMNVDEFGGGFYLNVLAHELRHMIEDNHDAGDIDWEVEGSAVLAEELAGYDGSGAARGNGFLENPDQQLNRWSDGDTYPHYGQGYLLNRYLYERLGPEGYLQFATHPADGLDAVTAVAAANNLPFDGHTLWLDWLAALAVHNRPQAPQRYQIGNPDLGTATAATIGDLPSGLETTVSQYAADYYRLEGDGAVTIDFAGAGRVPLLGIPAASGDHFWYANRANYSHMQLTGAFDLRETTAATLQYSVYQDIEYGYDYAYLFASVDGGASWEPLSAPNMQGEVEADNPSQRALAARFYTGRHDGWAEESVDLSPYAGREILLRFAYVTDPILTFGGLALDNIAIPEIGFYDDAETAVANWQSDGFTRATATLPQPWHLQLITFPGGAPEVTMLSSGGERAVQHTVNLGESGGEAILIVAASAPLTLESGTYRLSFAE